MAEVILLDSQEKFLGVLNNTLPNAPSFWADEHDERLNDADIFYTFTTEANRRLSKHVKAENHVMFKNVDGEHILMRIRRVETDKTDSQKLIVFTEHAAMSELNEAFPIAPKKYQGYTLRQAADEMLYGTEWITGICDWAGTETWNLEEYVTPLAGIHTIRAASQFDCDLKFRVEWDYDRNVLRGKYVDFLERRGEQTGYTLEYYRNIRGFRKVESSEELVTALVGVGKADEGGKFVTFESIAWSKANGDPADKPAGQNWIGDPEAFQLWNKKGKHKFGIYNSEASTPNALIHTTWNKLQKLKAVQFTYEVDAAVLRKKLGYNPRLGDSLYVKDYTGHEPIILNARIIEEKRSYSDPSGASDAFVIGEFEEVIVDDFDAIRRLQITLHKKEGQWDASGKIYKGTTPPEIESFAGVMWIDTNFTPNVAKTWDENTVSWVKATPQYANEMEYADGQKVEYYRPNEPGADITGNNTSQDTSNVGGTPSGTIKLQAGNGQTAFGDTSRWKYVGTDYLDATWVQARTVAAEKLIAGTITATSAVIATAAITTANIQDAAINSAKIANATITTADIANAQITNALIATAAIETANIKDANITTAKIGLAQITNAQIAAAAITDASIALATITSARIADAQITTAKIANLAVDTAKIKDLSVATAKIADAAIDNAKIALLAVGTANIQDAAIENAKIGTLAVGTANIADAAIVNAKIGNASITSAKIGTAQIATANIADLAVVGAKIASATITGAQIANAAIDSAQIKDAAITTAKLGAVTIGSAMIADASITNAKIDRASVNKLVVTSADIATATITNANIAAATITNASIALGTITTALIGDAQITTAKIGSLAVGTANIADAAIVTAKIGSAQITSALIADATIANADIANATITGAKIANATIGTANITDANITTAKIGLLAVTAAQIADATITTAKIGTAQITSALIADATIANADIANATIQGAKIASATIGTANIVDANITTAKIATGAITTALLGDAQITGAKIADAQITDAKILNLTAGKITAGTLDTALVTIQGTGGKLRLTGNRMQIFDAQTTPIERVSIGDVNGDGTVYGFRVRGANGTTVLYDESGVYNEGITNGAVTNPKIGDDAVDGRVIAANVVTAAHVLAGTITATEIASATITAAKMVAGTITAASGIIADATITSAKIADATIVNGDIANATILAAKIGNATITNAQIALATITTAVIADAQITGAKILDATITDAELANATILTASIADAQITGAKILDATISNADIANLTVTGAKIANATIDTTQIAAAAIENAQIADAAITTAKIGDAQITNAKITALDAAKITTGYLASARIAADTITAQQIVIGDYTNLVQIDEVTNPNGNTVVVLNNKEYFRNGPGAYASLQVMRVKNAEFKVNDEYYIKAFGYRDTTTTDGSFIVRYYYTDGTWANAGSTALTIPATTEGTIEATVKITVDVDPLKTLSYVAFFFEKPNVTTGYIYLRRIELRKRASNALIVDGAITAAKIATDAVDANKIAANAITAANAAIADAAILTAKIADAQITGAKILDATITNAELANTTITNAKIANATITATQIADATIGNAEIGNLAVTGAKIADGTITSAKIGDAQITTAKIGDAQITSAKIASIDASKITTGTLNAIDITGVTISGSTYSATFSTASNRSDMTMTSQTLEHKYTTLSTGAYSAGALSSGILTFNDIDVVTGVPYLQARSWLTGSSLRLFSGTGTGTTATGAETMLVNSFAKSTGRTSQYLQMQDASNNWNFSIWNDTADAHVSIGSNKVIKFVPYNSSTTAEVQIKELPVRLGTYSSAGSSLNKSVYLDGKIYSDVKMNEGYHLRWYDGETAAYTGWLGHGGTGNLVLSAETAPQLTIQAVSKTILMTAATLDINANADISGTLNVTGALTTRTINVNSGYDVNFLGAAGIRFDSSGNIRTRGTVGASDSWQVISAAGAVLIKALYGSSGGYTEIRRPPDVDLRPLLVNGWIEYGGSYTPPKAHKTSDDMVTLEGLVKSGTSGQICTLPAGWRPENLGFYLVMGTSNSVVRVDVYADGRVIINGTVPGFVSLNGIQFAAVN